MEIIKKFFKRNKKNKHDLTFKLLEKSIKEENFFNNLEENCITDKGIGIMSPFYIMDSPFTDKIKLYESLYDFIISYKEKYMKENNLSSKDISIKFINYGFTELVYLLEDIKNNKEYTLLVKQPEIPYGLVKSEHDNLINLAKTESCVVAPIDYYSDEQNELYVTHYIPYARCIANDERWGIYIPEPYYRFKCFTDEEESIVNSCMIAKLVSMYDFKNKEGIASCQIGSGDFMLKQGWENEKLSISNTLDSLYLISLRNKVNCEFEEYITLVRNEFSIPTYGDFDIIINKQNRLEMKMDDIKQGIELGRRLI